MKIKTAELIGPTLDWAVAQCEGYEYDTESGLLYSHEEPHFFKCYSSDWSQGGPIIEREQLCIGCMHQPDPNCCPPLDPDTLYWARTTSGGYLSYGPTHLIAAMRCFVASKFVNEVDMPEELLK